jgi:hypothetical protein
MHSVLGSVSVPIMKWPVVFILTDFVLCILCTNCIKWTLIWEIVSSSRYFSMRTGRQIMMKFDVHHRWQDSLFWALAFLRKFCQIASGFHFFGFHDKFFLLIKVVSLASNRQTGGPGPCIYAPTDKVVQKYNFACGSVWVRNLVSDIKGGT